MLGGPSVWGRAVIIEGYVKGDVGSKTTYGIALIQTLLGKCQTIHRRIRLRISYALLRWHKNISC